MVRARVELSVSYGDDLADCVAIVVLCAFHRSLAGANCEGIDSPPTAMARTPQIRRRDLVGGLVHEYELAA